MPATMAGQGIPSAPEPIGHEHEDAASWRTSSSVPSVSAHASARSAGIRTAKLLPQRWTRLGTVGPPSGIYVGHTSEDGQAQLADAGPRGRTTPCPTPLPTDGLAS